jgi:hypothetical protein
VIRGPKDNMEREGAQIGLFVTVHEPTKEPQLEATTGGFNTSPIGGRDCPPIQILVIRQLLEEHAKPMLPLLNLSTYQQTDGIPRKGAAEQQEIFGS